MEIWGDWLKENFEMSQPTVSRFVQAAELSNSTAMLNMAPTKVFAILDVPAADRETFLSSKELTEEETTIMTDFDMQKLVNGAKHDEETLEDGMKKLKKIFKIRSNKPGMVLLLAIKKAIEKGGPQYIKQQGILIIALASTHDEEPLLNERELLRFFGTTKKAVTKSVGEKFLNDQGLYRALVTSPALSATCKLFFDAWFTAVYDKSPLKCFIRRVGKDAFKLVTALPGGDEYDHPEAFTGDEISQYTNCPREHIDEMPIVH